ncbi:hypothetical protein ABW21_db0200549 [Orbilia brochopaga]|nr:hypothetical protein ABW21_db0200549 [Drechslerella brochopaga]
MSRLSLYRRLLRHSQKISVAPRESPAPAADVPADTPIDVPALETTAGIRKRLKTIITKEFRKHTRRDFKVSELRETLLCGYVAVGTLREAVEQPLNPDAIAPINIFLERYKQGGPKPLQRMQSTRITTLPEPKPKRAKSISPSLKDIPEKYRHKATLVAGNVMPFVRFTGTKQALALTGLLQKRMQQRIKREERLEDLHVTLDYAIWEDEFEKNVRANATPKWRKENPDDRVRYTTVPEKAKMELQGQIFDRALEAFQRADKCLDFIKDHEGKRRQLLSEAKQNNRKKKALLVLTLEPAIKDGSRMIQIPKGMPRAKEEVSDKPTEGTSKLNQGSSLDAPAKQSRKKNSKRKTGKDEIQDVANLASIAEALGGADVNVKEFLNEILATTKK